jgi:hypothetical protein
VHDARHTYASLMLRRGVPPAYVSRQLGQSSIQVTVDLYGHFIPGGDRHHVEGLVEALEESSTAAAEAERAREAKCGVTSRIEMVPPGDPRAYVPKQPASRPG